MRLWTKDKSAPGEPAAPPYPGISRALDGSGAVVAMETAAGEAAGAYPITPSTQMGEGWAAAVAEGRENVNGRRLLFFEPEGEHAAAAVTAGMSMAGLRATNFSSGQGIAYMHESLYAAVGKRLTYVLNVAARAMTKHALNVHAGHDDYHAIDDTGFFQLFAKDVQEAADLNLIAHRIAELSLNPGICAQDGFLTSHVIESVWIPEPALVKAFLGDPADRHRIAHAGPAPGVRRHAPADSGDVRSRLPGHVGRGPEPGQLRAGRGRPAAVLLRSRGGAGQPRVRRVCPAHRPPLRARHGLPARGRRMGDRRAGLPHSQCHGGGRPPAQRAQAEGGRAQPHHVPPLPGGPHCVAARRQTRRRGARAPRSAAGRRSAPAARDPRRHVAGR